jgi:hypothetical protein
LRGRQFLARAQRESSAKKCLSRLRASTQRQLRLINPDHPPLLAHRARFMDVALRAQGLALTEASR